MLLFRKIAIVVLLFNAMPSFLYGQEIQNEKWSFFWKGYALQENSRNKLIYAIKNAVEPLKGDPKQGITLIDSLRSEVSDLNMTDSEVLQYNRLQLEIFHRNFLIQEATELSSQLNREVIKSSISDLNTLIDIHLTLGDFSLDAQYPDSAIYHFQNAKIYSEAIQDTIKLWTSLNKKAFVHDLLGAYDKVVEDQLEAYFLAKELSREDLLLTSLHSLAGGYRGLAEYTKAEEAFLEEIEMLLERDNKLSLAYAYGGLSANYSYSGQTGQSINYAEKALRLLEELGMKLQQAGLWVQYGTSLISENRLTEAEKALKIGEQMAEELAFEEAKVRVLLAYVQLELARDNYPIAESNLQKAFDALAGGFMNKSEELAHELAVEYYSKKGDYEKAFLSQKRLSVLKDSVLRVQKANQLMEYQTKYGTLEMDRKIQETGLALKEEEARTQRVVIGLGVLLVVLLIMIYLVVQLKRSRDKIKESSQILKSQKEELEQLNKTKDKLFSIIAHDLRSPMVALQGVGKKLDFFLRKGRQDKLQEMGDKIDRSIDNLNHLLNNLLNWASNESDGVPNNPTLFSCKELILETVELYRGMAESKNIRIELLLDENQLYVDRNMASTVIRNLLSNAIKFTPDSGQVRLETSMHGAFTKILITDKGKGIAQTQVQRIFSGDISESGTSGERGFGLGLKICNEFVKNMRGKIRVNSQLLRGTTFIVELPNNNAAES